MGKMIIGHFVLKISISGRIFASSAQKGMNGLPKENIITQLYLQGEDMIYNALPRTLQPGYFFGPHCHENVELCMMKEGCCDIIINGEVITVHEGKLLIIFSNMIHSFHMSANRPATFLQMHFKPDNFSNVPPKIMDEILFLKYMTDGHNSYLLQPFSPQLLSCVERICAETKDQDNVLHSTLAKIYVYEMIFLLSREISQSYRQVFSINNPIAIKAIQYISTHIDVPISLSDVADYCRVTPRYLSLVFKSTINLTVNEYVNIAKVESAMQKLMDTDLSISDIAAHLGFSSAQYFSTVFKKYTHVTPTEYRNMEPVEV